MLKHDTFGRILLSLDVDINMYKYSNRKLWTEVYKPPAGKRDKENKQLHLDTLKELASGNTPEKSDRITRELFGRIIIENHLMP